MSSPPPGGSPSPTSSPPPPAAETSPPSPSNGTVSPPPPPSPPSSPILTPVSPPTSQPSPASVVSNPPPPPGTRSLPSPPPPPRTPSFHSPPPPRSTVSSPGTTSSNGLSTELIVGIAAAGFLAFIVLSIFFFCCCKKKRRHHDSADYYGNSAPVPPKDPQIENPQRWQHNSIASPADHVMKMPSHPSPPPPYPSRPPRAHNYVPSLPAAPAFPVTSSSGGSGSNYSGSENPLPPPSPGIPLGFSKNAFTLQELSLATNSFSDANLLGQGGFGYVHKGVLANGKEVAVKSLKSGSGQGEREFQAEVEIISRVHHKHLVSLVGYCIAGGQRMLVYEFVPNGTLEFHLHGEGRPVMEWSTRLKIALGSAKGLAYLHEDCQPKIIHRDIKASNILLDFQFEPKVADFGLAKLASENNTHVSTRVMGTFGYLAPEYASSGKLTDKSDVFSFGVVLLELITGRRPVDSAQTYMDDSLVDWARPLLTRALEEHNYDTLADPRLPKNYKPNEMDHMIACAAACIRHSARRRPKMSQVLRALEGDISLESLNEGVRPGNSTPFGSYGGSSDYDASQYNEDMLQFRKMALSTSQDHASSEFYGRRTSDYGLYPSVSSSESLNTQGMEMRGARKDH